MFGHSFQYTCVGYPAHTTALKYQIDVSSHDLRNKTIGLLKEPLGYVPRVLMSRPYRDLHRHRRWEAGLVRDQASWNRSKALAAARGGARAGKPRWVRILAITGGMFDGGDDLQGAAALRALLDVDLEHALIKALPGFHPSGRRSPFKTRSRRFCEQTGLSSWGQVPREGAPQRGPLRGIDVDRHVRNDVGT